jgi:hypothetical protein
MAEQLDLTTPIVPASRTTYTITRLILDWQASVILVYLRGSDSVEVFAEYTGATASALMTTLNSANLSTISLYKRVLQKLVTDGKLPAGTVSGTPS